MSLILQQGRGENRHPFGDSFHFCEDDRGAGDFPQLLLLENRRKIEPKEIPSWLIPRQLVVFTRQLEMLVTTLLSDSHAESSCAQDTIDIFISYKHVQMKK